MPIIQKSTWISVPQKISLRKILLYLTSITSVFACAYTQANDWPAFLGPHGNGISTETDLRLDWDDHPPDIIWQKALGESYSAPVVYSNRVFIFHRLQSEEILECLNAGTGETIWSDASPTAYVDRYGYNGGPRSSPLVYSNRVYTIGVEGLIICRDIQSGRPLWKRHINQEYNIPQNFFGVASAPVITDGVLLFNSGAKNGYGIMGLNAEDGSTKWHVSNQTASYSTPSVGRIGNLKKAAFLTREGLVILSPDNGNLTHTYPFRSTKHESVNAATPVFIDDKIFISSSYNTGAALLDLSDDKLIELWRTRQVFENHWATSIYHQGYLYGIHGRHESEADIRCIKLEDGSLQWQSPRGLGRASFIMAANHLITLGERGDLALIKVSPDKYVEVFRKHYLEYPSWTPPVLSNGRLFIRNETQLLCLNVLALEQSSSNDNGSVESFMPIPIKGTSHAHVRKMNELNNIVSSFEKPDSPTPLNIIFAAGKKTHGPNAHDYPAFQQHMVKLFGFDTNVTTDTSWIFPTEEQYARADVVVFNSMMDDLSSEHAERLNTFIKNGGGVVYIHIGIQAHDFREEQLPNVGLVWSGKCRYRHGPVTLDFSASSHPITHGFTKHDFYDETYWQLKGNKEDITILATSMEKNSNDEAAVAHPQIWVKELGKGRIVANILGHYSWTYDDPLFRILLMRSIAWAGMTEVDRFNHLILPGTHLLKEDPLQKK